MAPGDPERPDRPEYNVYRGGSRSRGRGRRAKTPRDAAPSAPATPSSKQAGSGDGEGTGYTVYKGGRRFGRGERSSGAGAFTGLRERFGRGGRGGGSGLSGKVATEGGFPWRRILKWGALALGAWLTLSLILFCISAQIQKGKLDDGAADQLGGFPLMLFSGQTILVIGTDARPEGTNEGGAETDPDCLEKAATGAATANVCASPSRADTLMLVRAGGGGFEKLSIPRDVLTAIPGQESQKINAAYAFGGAELQIETIQDFLGIDIDHVVILDFEGFADFIDSIGGVQVDLPKRVKSKISGGTANGGVSLDLPQGENDLNGQEALALARTRENLRDPSEGDPERAQRQQLILQGIQQRLTSPTRIPYNLIHAPWIAWNAPKAMVTDMGAFTLPQLVMSAAIGGSSDTKILKPSWASASGALIVEKRQCEKAVEAFLGKEGPREPQCSPSG